MQKYLFLHIFLSINILFLQAQIVSKKIYTLEKGELVELFYSHLAAPIYGKENYMLFTKKYQKNNEDPYYPDAFISVIVPNQEKQVFKNAKIDAIRLNENEEVVLAQLVQTKPELISTIIYADGKTVQKKGLLHISKNTKYQLLQVSMPIDDKNTENGSKYGHEKGYVQDENGKIIYYDGYNLKIDVNNNGWVVSYKNGNETTYHVSNGKTLKSKSYESIVKNLPMNGYFFFEQYTYNAIFDLNGTIKNLPIEQGDFIELVDDASLITNDNLIYLYVKPGSKEKFVKTFQGFTSKNCYGSATGQMIYNMQNQTYYWLAYTRAENPTLCDDKGNETPLGKWYTIINEEDKPLYTDHYIDDLIILNQGKLEFKHLDTDGYYITEKNIITRKLKKEAGKDVYYYQFPNGEKRMEQDFYYLRLSSSGESFWGRTRTHLYISDEEKPINEAWSLNYNASNSTLFWFSTIEEEYGETAVFLHSKVLK